MDIVERAVNNERNLNIMDESLSKIKNDKNDILQYIGLKGKELSTMHKQLKLYRYIESIDEIQSGCYVRYIYLKTSYRLLTGGIVVNIKQFIHDNDNDNDSDYLITLKNKMNRFFTIKFNQIILFQKLTDQEQIILKLLKYIE